MIRYDKIIIYKYHNREISIITAAKRKAQNGEALITNQ